MTDGMSPADRYFAGLYRNLERIQTESEEAQAEIAAFLQTGDNKHLGTVIYHLNLIRGLAIDREYESMGR